MRQEKLFGEAPIFNVVLKFALPSIMGQIVLVIYNMADTFFVGLADSDIMLTAITVTLPAFMFLSAIANLFGIGGSSLIARSLGKKDSEMAKSASSFAILGCVLVTLIYSLLAFLFIDYFVDILGGTDSQVHILASNYLKVTVVFGGLFTSLSMLLGHLVRSEGNSLKASLGVVIGGVLNIVLDPIFMFILLPKGNEVLGAAIATSISNLCSFVYFLIIVIKNRKNSHIRLRIDKRIILDEIPRDVIYVGLPASIMTLFENVSYAVLENCISAYGVDVQAGLGVAKKINMLAHSCVRGTAQGVLPLLAYNYSAEKYNRMKKTVLISMSITVGIALFCMIACLIFSDGLVSVFIRNEGVSNMFAEKFLKIFCVGAPFSACAYTFISFFQAVGKGNVSFVLAILRKGIVDIPMMIILDGIISIQGAVLATPITDALCCVVSIIFYTIFLRNIKYSI